MKKGVDIIVVVFVIMVELYKQESEIKNYKSIRE